MLIECGGFKILTDPWITGIAGGRYVHEPPLKTPVEQIADVDLIILSHAHPDHFNRPSLELLNRRAAVIVPRHFGETEDNPTLDIGWRNPDLAREIRELGFEEVLEIGPWGEVEIDNGIRVTSAGSHHDHFPEMGFLVTDGQTTLYNGVDTWPGEPELRRVGAAAPDVAFLPFRFYIPPALWTPIELPDEERARAIAETQARFRWVGPLRATYAAGALGVKAVVPGSEGFRDILPSRQAYGTAEGANYHEVCVGDREDFVTLVRRHLPQVDVAALAPGDRWDRSAGFQTDGAELQAAVHESVR